MVKKINRAKVQNNYELANLLSGLLQQKSQYLFLLSIAIVFFKNLPLVIFPQGTKEPASKIQVVGLCSVPKSYKPVL